MWGYRDLRRCFHGLGRVTLTAADGETLSGRGIVSALNKESAEPFGKRHELGVLPRPLYHFVGWLDGLENRAGDVLSQAGKSYTVLDARAVTLGEKLLCQRALLEAREEEP